MGDSYRKGPYLVGYAPPTPTASDCPHNGCIGPERYRDIPSRPLITVDCAGCLRRNARSAIGSACIVRSMSEAVGVVLDMRRPAQIVSAIVERITVAMSDVMCGCWLGIKKCLCDQNMDTAGVTAAISKEIMLQIRRAVYGLQYSANPRTGAGSQPLYSSEIRNSVVWECADSAPFFFGVRGVSHGAVSSHGGQGRARQQPRFRPVFYASSATLLQGIAA